MNIVSRFPIPSNSFQKLAVSSCFQLKDNQTVAFEMTTLLDSVVQWVPKLKQENVKSREIQEWVFQPSEQKYLKRLEKLKLCLKIQVLLLDELSRKLFKTNFALQFTFFFKIF